MNKELPRQIIRAVLFLLLLAMLLSVFSQIYRPRDNTRSGGMYYNEAHGYMSIPADELDMFSVGCSNFYNSIDPLRLWQQKGITSYDMSTGGQRVYESYYHLKEIFRDYHPQLIVLDAYTVMREGSGDDAIFTASSYYYPVFFYHNNWKIYDLDLILSPIHYTYRSENKGYRPGSRVNQVEEEPYMNPTDENASFPLMNRLFLRMIQSLCKENQAQLLLVAMPGPAIWDYSSHNVMEAEAAKLGIDFLDLNMVLDEVGIDFQTDYRDDGDHLNDTGAMKVTDYLGNLIAEKYQLQDHRGDPAYAQWDEDLADAERFGEDNA